MAAKAQGRRAATAAGPLLLLLVLAMVWGWGLVVQAAYVQDRLFADRARDRMAGRLRAAETALGDRALGYAWQDEAALRLEVLDSPALRWAEARILRPAEDALDLSAALIVDGAGRVASVHIDALPAEDRTAQAIVRGLQRLAAQAMTAPPGKPLVASGLVVLNGRIHLAAAVRITPLRRAMAEPPDAVLILTQGLGDIVLPGIALIEDLSHNITLMAEAPDGTPNLPLSAADGTPLGVLAWTAPKPGREVLANSLPLLLGGSAVLAGVTWLLLLRRQQTRTITRDFDVFERIPAKDPS